MEKIDFQVTTTDEKVRVRICVADENSEHSAMKVFKGEEAEKIKEKIESLMNELSEMIE